MRTRLPVKDQLREVDIKIAMQKKIMMTKRYCLVKLRVNKLLK